MAGFRFNNALVSQILGAATRHLDHVAGEGVENCVRVTFEEGGWRSSYLISRSERRGAGRVAWASWCMGNW